MSDDSGRPDLVAVAEERIVDRQPDVILGGPFIPPDDPDLRAYLYGLFAFASPGDTVMFDGEMWVAGLPSTFGIPLLQKGAPSGVAELDAAGNVLDGDGDIVGAPQPERIERPWALIGPVLPGVLPGYFVSVTPGHTKKALEVLYKSTTGAFTFYVRRTPWGGVAAPLTGFGTPVSPLSATTAAALADPADVALADHDYIDIVVVSSTGGDGPAITLVEEEL